jgi:hypothetical protein
MANHIDELAIRSLRRLRDLHLPQLGNVNLLVGENNSGKTTVLEAIALFCRPLDPLAWLAVARSRAIRLSRESVLENVRWLFPQISADTNDSYYQGEVRIEGQGDFPCLESLARFHGFGAFEEDSSNSCDEEEHSGSSDAEDNEEESLGSLGPMAHGAEITLSAHVAQDRWRDFDAGPDGMLSYQFELLEDERYIKREPPGKLRLPLATISPISHRVEQLQVSQLSEATLSGDKFSVLECVKLIDPEVKAIEIISRQGKRPTLWVRHQTSGYAPLYTLGDGVRRVLTMALGLSTSQNGVLLIDEIETAIHNQALGGVFRWLVGAAAYYKVQVFATTHSLEALDAVLSAKREQLSDLALYRLPPQDSGRRVARYEGKDAYSIRYNSGLELR